MDQHSSMPTHAAVHFRVEHSSSARTYLLNYYSHIRIIDDFAECFCLVLVQYYFCDS